jgi:hypothetical protein
MGAWSCVSVLAGNWELATALSGAAFAAYPRFFVSACPSVV